MALCEICNTPYRLIHGNYICKEGHVSHVTQEVADTENVAHRNVRRKTKKEESKFKKYNLKYRIILFHRLLYADICKHFGCDTTKYYKYYCNFFTGNRINVCMPFIPKFSHVIMLVYLSVREMYEKQGMRIYYVNFINEFRNLDIKDKIEYYKNILALNKIKKCRIMCLLTAYKIMNKRHVLYKLTKGNYQFTRKYLNFLLETSKPHPRIEYDRAFLREDLRMPMDRLLEYYDEICKLIEIPDYEKYKKLFIKYIKIRNLKETIYFPEDEVCVFLYLCDKQVKFEIDYKKAYRNINLFINNELFDGEVTFNREVGVADVLTLITGYSVITFYNEVYKKTYKDFKLRNDAECIRKPFLSHRNNNLWRALEIYIDRVKLLFDNKKNFEIKKKYFEEDMI